MIRLKSDKSPSFRGKKFILHGNIKESKLPYYDSINDPHLSNYFFSRRFSSKQLKSYHPVYNAYSSNKSFSGHNEQKFSIRLPSITRLTEKKFKPLSAEQFKKVLMKYRKQKNNPKEISPKP